LVLGILYCSGGAQILAPQEAALAEALEAAGDIEGMRSLVVARDGDLVAQRYYNGAGPDSPQDVKSVTLHRT
jgi:hypothetical protein